MSTTTWYAALAATLITTAWLLPMGVVRMLARDSGAPGDTPGMRKLALVTLVLGCISAVACVSIAAVIALR